jgi:hypothetical protein
VATAPKPGQIDEEYAQPNRAARRQASRDSGKGKPAGRVKITLCGSTLELGMPLPFKELSAVRMATQLPFEAFWAGEIQITEQSCQVMWWLARRANGEPRLVLERVLDEWPEGLTPGDIEVEEITDDEEPTSDPEG